MNLLSILLLIFIVLWIVAAVIHLIRHGGCGCGGKDNCSGSCGSCGRCCK